jgi:hypothetical protein
MKTCRMRGSGFLHHSLVFHSRLTLETDGIFRDGYATQLATVTGDASSGYTARLTIGLPV